MTGLGDTLANLSRYRQGLESLVRGRAEPAVLPYSETAEFGANPGDLRMLSYAPPQLAAAAPLVVALHGCGQNATGLADGAGWTELAARLGFFLLLPEQRRANNAQGCFNWFQPEDAARGLGEAASIRAMIQHTIATYRLDRRRVFITGLSAGAAFANVMLACYPEVFAAGAIIAGPPFGVAHDTKSALAQMFSPPPRTDRELGDAVRAASPGAGPWPRVSVWHGLADSIVVPANATEVARQWRDVHGLGAVAPHTESWGRATHLSWAGRDGRPVVEITTIPHLNHAIPISPNDLDPSQRCGGTAPFIVDTGLSSSYLIARFWGLATPAVVPASRGLRPGGIVATLQGALGAIGLGGPRAR